MKALRFIALASSAVVAVDPHEIKRGETETSGTQKCTII